MTAPRKPPPILIPRASSGAALIGGVPLASVIVWYIDEFMLPPGRVLEPAITVALGSTGAILVGECWRVLKRLMDRIAPNDEPGE